MKPPSRRSKPGFIVKELGRDLVRNRIAYLMLLPALAYYFLFRYMPLYGAQIAFRNYDFMLGIVNSEWVGFQNFQTFFNSYYFWRLLRNTVLLSGYCILFGFPAPILLALFMNELRSSTYKRITQTITYLPHFISIVVVCGWLRTYLARDGFINDIVVFLGGERKAFLQYPEYFRMVYVVSDIWQSIGWGSIIYLAALGGINSELYDACNIDGGGRLRQTLHVTLPGITPTIVIMLILRMGRLMSVGQEKVLLLYNTNTYETADIISTFVYRKGLMDMNYSYSTAIGLFNSVINFALLIFVNQLSKKLTDTSLW